MKESDVVVTNPPFSLFREYVAQLVQYGKKFLIIGPKNALHYKEVFPLIQKNMIWVGHTPMSRDLLFEWPEAMQKEAITNGRQGSKFRLVGGVALGRSPSIWFTNLDHKKRHEEYVFIRKYNPEDFPYYANLEAIDVGRQENIPEDWFGLMGVPDTFLDIYNPEQFEIVWTTDRGGDGRLEGIKLPHTRFDAPVVKGEGQYKRILIRRKKGYCCE